MWWVKYAIMLTVLLIVIWIILAAKKESERMNQK